MKFVLRDTIESDLPAVFRIRRDPLVRPHQYQLGKRDTVVAWKDKLFGDQGDCLTIAKCTTILDSDEIIGHIDHYHYYDNFWKRLCYCGWNLAPAYWGRGIMRVALSQLFDFFFVEQKVDTVISDCFSNNHRCIRLMEKLGYHPLDIPLVERLRILFSNWCWHWILRFGLSSEVWRRRSRTSSIQRNEDLQ